MKVERRDELNGLSLSLVANGLMKSATQPLELHTFYNSRRSAMSGFSDYALLENWWFRTFFSEVVETKVFFTTARHLFFLDFLF